MENRDQLRSVNGLLLVTWLVGRGLADCNLLTLGVLGVLAAETALHTS